MKMVHNGSIEKKTKRSNKREYLQVSHEGVDGVIIIPTPSIEKKVINICQQNIV